MKKTRRVVLGDCFIFHNGIGGATLSIHSDTEKKLLSIKENVKPKKIRLVAEWEE